MFLNLDTNNDGFLTIDELRAGFDEISKIFQMQEIDVEKMMKACDGNGDGRIDYTEFIAAAFEKDLLLTGDNLRDVFALLDQDGNGKITKDELKCMFGGGDETKERGEEMWDKIMDEVDKNRDGEIQFEEFEEAMRSVLNHRASFYKKDEEAESEKSYLLNQP